jgi:serine/threonine protein kinase/Flp pilus assembly protein TadD
MDKTDPKIDTILAQAVDIASEPERRAYVDKACAGNDLLRGRVERLIANHFRAGSFLEQPVAGVETIAAPTLTEGPGTRIGHYKLMEQIGEGGMGLVYVAEQQHPVRRRVALKLIKPGMDTRQVIARFEAERQALALMDHPNIAKIFDAGTTGSRQGDTETRRHGDQMQPSDQGLSVSLSPGLPVSVSPTGRPYFVMELVKGVPITEYCDDNRLTPRERLELFRDVCGAVQHAHQKGIIHRDIKPSNVLVVSHDGTPVVKVIDFGVAKAVGQQLTDKTVYTQFAQFIGTPLYMSPEQAGQSGIDVDTRTDIYALGVLLYELLTGTTPFDKDRLREAGYDEIRRLIREEEPPKPSTRISTLGQAGSTVSAQRQSDPKQLCKLLRGELDWIVMKALEKDRNRRYESASALAADVQRYLQDEPVEACPPSTVYRLGKFLRRHRTSVLTATCLVTVALALSGFIGYVLLDRHSRLAKIGHNVAEALAGARAAMEAGDLNLTLQRTALAEGYLENDREHFSSLQAEINGVRLAIKTRRASELPQHVAALRKAMEVNSNDVAVYHNLGNDLYYQQKFPAAEAVWRKAIDIDSEDGFAYHGLSNVLYLQQKLPEAVAAAREAIKLKPRFANAYSTLGVILRAQQKFAEADDAQRKATQINDAIADANFGYLLMAQGQFAMAVDSFKRASEIVYNRFELERAKDWLDLDAKLPQILNREALPSDAAECFAWAEFCQLRCRQCYAASARFYGQTFAADPTLVDDLRTNIRYDAARASALAGCAQGKDAAQLEAKEYARLRGQALAWLRADLTGWRQELRKEAGTKRNGVRYEMHQWQQDTDFNGVRGDEALAKLPEAERQEWRKLWEEVEELRRQAAEGK